MSKLLIVDDEIDVREFAKRFFAKRGIEVSAIGDGYEAVKVILEESPDLVLLDIYMDGMSGIEVLQNIRESGSDVNVIMVSGVEDEEIVKKAHSFGIKGYIHKPLILEELEKIVMAELKRD